MIRLKWLLILMLSGALYSSAYMQDNPTSPEAYPEVALKNTETFALTSSNGRAYQIYVALPEGYTNASPQDDFSVVYVLDADFYFGTITEFTRVEDLVMELPKLIVVGIGYADNPLQERITDMLEQPAQFLEFIGDELVPLIDERYQIADSEQTLLGHSLGGQFVLYTLFSRPELFSYYVAASPGSPSWSSIIPLEEAFANQHTELPIRLFMSAGEVEEIRPLIESMHTRIQNRDYAGLALEYRLIEDATHGSSAMPAFSYGLRYLYQA